MIVGHGGSFIYYFLRGVSCNDRYSHFSGSNEVRALPSSQRVIEMEQPSSCTPDPTPRENRTIVVQNEVVVPLPRTRIEQENDFAAPRISRGQVRTFRAIAFETGIRKIV
jgi:hypothetical protein